MCPWVLLGMLGGCCCCSFTGGGSGCVWPNLVPAVVPGLPGRSTQRGAGDGGSSTLADGCRFADGSRQHILSFADGQYMPTVLP